MYYIAKIYSLGCSELILIRIINIKVYVCVYVCAYVYNKFNNLQILYSSVSRFKIDKLILELINKLNNA